MLSLGRLQKTHSLCGMGGPFEVNVSIAAQFTGALPLDDDLAEVLPSVFRGIHMEKNHVLRALRTPYLAFYTNHPPATGT